MEKEIMFVITRGLVDRYENGVYKDSVFEKDVPEEEPVEIPQVRVISINEKGVATLVYQISKTVYKKLGYACLDGADFMLSYWEHKEVAIEPGSPVFCALEKYNKHLSVEDLCKAPK